MNESIEVKTVGDESLYLPVKKRAKSMENGLLAKRYNSIIDNLMPTATKKMKEMASYVLSENDTS